MIERSAFEFGDIGVHMLHSQSRITTEPQGAVVLFPPSRQSREIDDLARRLARKRTQAAADRECARVADAMFARLAALGLSEHEQDEAVGAFFHEVDGEVERLLLEKAPGCACCKEA